MSKYDPLRRFLAKRERSFIELSFSDVERIIGELLPKSAGRAQWWANETGTGTSHVQCKAWLGAGYEARLIGRDRVRFDRRRLVPLENSR